MIHYPLPDDVIAIWPEVFGEVSVRHVPLSYVNHIKVHFENGDIWKLDASNYSGNNLDDDLEILLHDYKDEIVDMDFKIDAFRLKYDIQKFTAELAC